MDELNTSRKFSLGLILFLLFVVVVVGAVFFFLKSSSSKDVLVQGVGSGFEDVSTSTAEGNSSGVGGNSTSSNSTISSCKDSPFGIYSPYFENVVVDKTNISIAQLNTYLKDIGVKWVQEVAKLDLDDVQYVPQGINTYSRITYYDSRKPINNYNSKAYQDEVRSIIKKYKDKVKVWEVDTEPSGQVPPDGWQGDVLGYVKFLGIVSGIIKNECKDCKVVFGGLGGSGVFEITKDDEHDPSPKFFKEALDAGAAQYFDVFEFKQHHSRSRPGAEDYILLKNKFNTYRDILLPYGKDLNNMPVYIETAMYDGTLTKEEMDPREPIAKYLTTQTEADQAIGLVKTYIYGNAQGIDKIFWNFLIERKAQDTRPMGVFAHYGLIHTQEPNFPKKLSYYSYKKMVEVLSGVNWCKDKIETVKEGNGLYIYKINKNGKNLWIAWSENKQPEKIKVSDFSTGKVTVTESVPSFKTGAEVSDYSRAFNSYVKSSGEYITLSDQPVYIEEGGGLSKVDDSLNKPLEVPTSSNTQTQDLPSGVMPPNNKLCGDGICDAFEKAHPDVCPIDCK